MSIGGKGSGDYGYLGLRLWEICLLRVKSLLVVSTGDESLGVMSIGGYVSESHVNLRLCLLLVKSLGVCLLVVEGTSFGG